jgi:hypothetical protein
MSHLIDFRRIHEEAWNACPKKDAKGSVSVHDLEREILKRLEGNHGRRLTLAKMITEFMTRPLEREQALDLIDTDNDQWERWIAWAEGEHAKGRPEEELGLAQFRLETGAVVKN